MTPLDLDAIRERLEVREEYHEFGLYAEGVIPTLIAEVEALREQLREALLPSLEVVQKIYADARIGALRAKLENAKEALQPFGRFGKAFLKFNHVPNDTSLPWMVTRQSIGTAELSFYDLQRASEALAELEDKKEP